MTLGKQWTTWFYVQRLLSQIKAQLAHTEINHIQNSACNSCNAMLLNIPELMLTKHDTVYW